MGVRQGGRVVDTLRRLYCIQRNPKGMLIRFLIGQTEDRETAERLESESAEHNDIVRFDYPDE